MDGELKRFKTEGGGAEDGGAEDGGAEGLSLCDEADPAPVGDAGFLDAEEF